MPKPLDRFPRSLDERREEITFARGRFLDALGTAKCSADSASEGVWSIAQVGYHLYLSEHGVTRMLLKLLAGEPGDIAGEARLIDEWDRLRRLVGHKTSKVHAPAMVVPDGAPELNEVIRLLAESRQALLQVLAEISEDDLGCVYAPHPLKLLGTLAGPSWISMIAFHELRHVGQVAQREKA